MTKKEFMAACEADASATICSVLAPYGSEGYDLGTWTVTINIDGYKHEVRKVRSSKGYLQGLIEGTTLWAGLSFEKGRKGYTNKEILVAFLTAGTLLED